MPVLRTHPDGGVYSVDLQVKKLESRLAQEETRSGALQQDVTALRTERETLSQQFATLQSDFRRLRKQVEDASQPPRAPVGAPPPEVPPTGPAPPATPTDPEAPGDR